MIFKLSFENKLQENSQIMFQICVLNQKVHKMEATLCSLNFFMNAMIRNHKIHNIFDVIEISKSMELNTYVYFL
jgi:hypothetical protein